MRKQSLLQASLLATLIVVASANVLDDLEITWGNGRATIVDNGNVLQLSLDQTSGSGFQSKLQYLFGWFEMKIKLVPGNSAGTVTAFYMTSQGSAHDEVDLEFLGNTSGQPYILQTNVFTQGMGNREQRFYLWFDPTEDFHTYAILWNPKMIAIYVDKTPIRVFRNTQSIGVPYANSQPMQLVGTLWDGEDWATQGGRVKTDWSLAPFVADYQDFRSYACTWIGGRSSCLAGSWWDLTLDSAAAKQLEWVREKWMIYDYCQDRKRFPQGPAPECSLNT